MRIQIGPVKPTLDGRPGGRYALGVTVTTCRPL